MVVVCNTIIFGHGHYRCMVMLAVHVFVCQCWQLCTCTLACLWQDCVQIPYHHVSPYVNVVVSGDGGALVRKLAFGGGCASELVMKCWCTHTRTVCGINGYNYACEMQPYATRTGGNVPRLTNSRRVRR